MNIIKAVRERRSIRKFIEKDIPEDILSSLMDALIWAPSAGNLQSRRFFFVKNKEIKHLLAGAALNQRFIHDAPVAIVCCTDSSISRHYGQRGTDLYTIQDVSASIMGMMLVAHEEGLGTVWIGAFNDDQVTAVLDLPFNLRPVAMVPVGYPASIPKAPERVSKEHAVQVID